MVEHDNAMGALVIGAVLCVLLYGTIIAQVLEYYQHCARDARWLKTVIVFLCILNTLHTVLVVMQTYGIFVTLFGNLDKGNKTTWVGGANTASATAISVVVQLVFGYRVLRLSHNKWLYSHILATALTYTAGGIVAAVKLTMIDTYSDRRQLKAIFLLWIGSAVATDTLIMSSLVFYLRKERTGFSITDDLISKIIRATLQTGMITVICAMLDLILYCTFDNDLHMVFNLPLSKVYTNSLLSTLNARSRWADSQKEHSSSICVDDAPRSTFHATGHNDTTSNRLSHDALHLAEPTPRGKPSRSVLV